MNRDEKKKVMGKYGMHQKDTGSAQVQVAILTEKINNLSKHLEKHPKDANSRRGLLMMVGERSKNLKYLRLHKEDLYKELIKKLKLRK